MSQLALLEQEFMGAAFDGPLYVDDVFSAYTYLGNGGTQILTDGIDRTAGAMEWFKNRQVASNGQIYDTLRGVRNRLVPNLTQGAVTETSTGITAFGTTGVTITDDSQGNTGVNGGAGGSSSGNPSRYVKWTFRQADKFFKMALVNHVNGTPTSINAASLGAVGMVTVKSTSFSSNWYVWNRQLTAGQGLVLNSTAVPATGYITVSGTTITMDASFTTGQYIVYAWAHDTASDGMIQCGTFTGNTIVSTGWEPQWMLMKPLGAVGDWYIVDQTRGWTADGGYYYLNPSNAGSETVGSGNTWTPQPYGFSTTGFGGGSYLYMVIRRPNKPAALLGASKVFCSVPGQGIGTSISVSTPGFPADMIMAQYRSAYIGTAIGDRLRGGDKYLLTASTSAENTTPPMMFDVMTGFGLTGSGFNDPPYIMVYQAFKRSPGFFDEVCYTGTGANRAIVHNLGAVPGMMWILRRDSGGFHKNAYHSAIGPTGFLITSGQSAINFTGDAFNNTVPTSGTFALGTNSAFNASGGTYVAFLFGDTPGLCKAFNYSGTVSDVAVSLGFNPRFVLIKRTDASGDWFVFDTARGIVSGNDPYMLLNSTAAETTTVDAIDPITNGFSVVAGTNVNINGASYIGWACA